jgi:2-polyprenyl-6-methoxyphenol hydroxylase-like FAD-dependent oxidoreductase
VVVIIAGAGIAGTALALALHEAGIQVTVREAHPQSSADAGAFLTLAENGMRALTQLGADGPVTAASAPLRRMRVSSADATQLATAPLGEPGGPGYRYLTRARLCAVLQHEVQARGIEIRRGERLVGFEPDPSGVTAVFADGSRARGDVLVGADGLRSTVRGLLDPAAAPPRYVGQRVFYGYSSDPGIAGEPGTLEFVRGAAAFGYIVTGQAGTWWFARVTAEELGRDRIAARPTDDWKDQLTALLRDDPGLLAIVRGTERVLVTDAYDLANVRTWHRDRTIVIGDAAHAASPATGQGASMALEDAVALAGALRDEADPAAAFAVYEELRRERVEANTAASASMSART